MVIFFSPLTRALVRNHRDIAELLVDTLDENGNPIIDRQGLRDALTGAHYIGITRQIDNDATRWMRQYINNLENPGVILDALNRVQPEFNIPIVATIAALNENITFNWLMNWLMDIFETINSRWREMHNNFNKTLPNVLKLLVFIP